MQRPCSDCLFGRRYVFTLLVLFSISAGSEAAFLHREGTASSARHLSPPQECDGRLQALRDPEVARQVARCEKERGFGMKVVAALPIGKTEAASTAVEEMLIVCANFTQPCARTSARRVAEELLNPGAAISERCQREVQAVQSDAKALQHVQQCEMDEGIVLKIQSAMHRGDLSISVSMAQENLKKCMKVSNVCSQQLAPIIVDNVLIQEMLTPEGQPQTLKPQSIQAFVQVIASQLLPIALTERLPSI